MTKPDPKTIDRDERYEVPWLGDTVNLKTYTKFVVALVGFAALVAKHQGVAGVEELSDQLIALLTAAGVFLFPNG